jgi:hypothetical protein
VTNLKNISFEVIERTILVLMCVRELLNTHKNETYRSK